MLWTILAQKISPMFKRNLKTAALTTVGIVVVKGGCAGLEDFARNAKEGKSNSEAAKNGVLTGVASIGKDGVHILDAAVEGIVKLLRGVFVDGSVIAIIQYDPAMKTTDTNNEIANFMIHELNKQDHCNTWKLEFITEDPDDLNRLMYAVLDSSASVETTTQSTPTSRFFSMHNSGGIKIKGMVTEIDGKSLSLEIGKYDLLNSVQPTEFIEPWLLNQLLYEVLIEQESAFSFELGKEAMESNVHTIRENIKEFLNGINWKGDKENVMQQFLQYLFPQLLEPIISENEKSFKDLDMNDGKLLRSNIDVSINDHGDIDSIPLLPEVPVSQMPVQSIEEIVENYFHLPNEKMPQRSSESNLLKLIASLWINIHCPEEAHRVVEADDDYHLPTAIKTRLDDLHVTLRQEGFFHPSFDQSAQVSNYWCSIQSDPGASMKTSGILTDSDEQRLLFLIRPLDSLRLLGMLEHNRKAENSIRDKKVLLMLGHTGAGKSTLTHFFAGSELTEYEEFGGHRLIRVAQMGQAPSLDKVEIGESEVSSKTRYVTALPIAASSVAGDLPNRSTETIFLCDTPGFEDNRGPEVQIATGQGIVDTVKKANCVWPMLIIGKDSVGPRWVTFRQLLKTIVSFIPNLHLLLQNSCFTYIFTRGWTETDKTFIYECISSILRDLTPQEQANTSFVALLADLQAQTFPGVGGWTRAHLLNVARTNIKPGDMLQSILSRNPIKDCPTNFSYIFTEESQRVISHQIRAHQQVINFTTSPPDESDFNFELANYHLSLVKKLSEKLSHQAYKVAAANFVKIVEGNLLSYVVQAKDAISSIFLSQSRWSSDGEKAAFLAEVKQFDQALENLEVARSELSAHVTRSFPNPDLLLRDLEDHLSSFIVKRLLPRSDGEAGDGNGESLRGLSCDVIRARLDRLVAAGTSSFRSEALQSNDLFDRLRFEIEDNVRDRHRVTCQSIKNLLVRGQIQEALQHLEDLKDAEMSLGSLLAERKENYVSLLDHCTDFFTKRSKEIDGHWRRDMSPEIISAIDLIAKDFSQWKMLHELEAHGLNSFLDKIISNFLDHVNAFAKQLSNDIIATMTNRAAVGLGNMKNKYDQLTALKKCDSLLSFKEISPFLFEYHTNAEKAFAALIQKISFDIEKGLPKLKSFQATKESNQELAITLKYLSEADWIKSFCPGEFENIRRIKSDILFAYESLKFQIELLELSLQRIDLIPMISHYKNQIDFSEVIANEIANVSKIMQEARKILMKKRVAILEEIQQKYSPVMNVHESVAIVSPSLKASYVLQVNEYLTACIKNGQVDCEEVKIFDAFSNYVSNYVESLDKMLQKQFTILQSIDRDASDEEEIDAAAYLFDQRLTELKSFHDAGIDEKHFHFWCGSHASGLLRYVFVLEQKRMGLLSNQDMKAVLMNTNICSNLARIDHLINFPGAKKFSDLRDQYYEAMGQLAHSLNQEMAQSIAKDDFPDVVINFHRFEEVNDEVTRGKITTAKRDLSKRLLNIRLQVEKQVKILSKDRNPIVMESLKENISKLHDAERTVFSKYVLPDVKATINDEFFIQMATGLYSFIQQKRNIDRLLEMNLYGQVEQQINQIEELLDHMNEMALTTVLINNQPQEINKKEIMSGLNQLIRDRFIQLEHLYESLPIAEYHSKPPQLCIDALSSLKEHQVYAKETVDKINTSIEAKFKSTINEILIAASSGEDKIYRLNELEVAIQTCPHLLQDKLRLLIVQNKTKVENASKEFIDRVQKTLEEPSSPFLLVNLFKEAQQYHYEEGKLILRKAIETKISFLESEIRASLKSTRTLTEINNHYRKLEEYSQSSDLLPAERELEIVRNITNVLTSLLIERPNQQQSPSKVNKQQLTLTDYQQIFQFLSQFSNLKLLFSKEHDVFKSVLVKCMLKILLKMEKDKRTFEIGLQQHDWDLVFLGLQHFHKFCGFHQIVKEFGLHISTYFAAMEEIKVQESPESSTEGKSMNKERDNSKSSSSKNRKDTAASTTLTSPSSKEKFDENLRLIEFGTKLASYWTLVDAEKILVEAFKESSTNCDNAFLKVVDKSGNSVQRTTFYRQIDDHTAVTERLITFYDSVHRHSVPTADGSNTAAPDWINTESYSASLNHPHANKSFDLQELIKLSLGWKGKLVNIIEESERELVELLQKSTITMEIKDKFCLAYDHLWVIGQEIRNSQINEKAQTTRNKVKETISNRIETCEKKIRTCITCIVSGTPIGLSFEEDMLKDLAKEFISLNILGQLHGQFEEDVRNKIDNYLKKLSADTILSLGDALREIDQGFDLVLSHSTIFEASLNNLRRNDTIHVTTKIAVDLLEGTNYNKEAMQVCATQFEEKYNLLVSPERLTHVKQEGIANYIAKLSNTIRMAVQDLPDPSKYTVTKGFVVWNQAVREAAVSLLPYIFAIKTLQSPKQSWTPHPVQVLSVLRILRADNSFDTTITEKAVDAIGFTSLGNHLLQIGTGEGKSVTLAITACVFALLGYDVNCSCYSEYLSERDDAAFRQLFMVLGLNELQIEYGTFSKLAEGFINQHGEIRERIRAVVTKKAIPPAKRVPIRPRILLVDEVDVFLDPSFYCHTYNPVAGLYDTSINELFQSIWAAAGNDPAYSFEKLRDEIPFKECLRVFKDWSFLIERESKKMIKDALSVRKGSNTAHFWNDQTKTIGYKKNDGVSYAVSYGYETIFLYFKECEERKLSIDIALGKCAIKLDCGHYLYGELCSSFTGIIGVTGTFRALTTLQKESLKKVFNIVSESYIPSAYGERRTRFTFLANDSKYLQIIPNSGLHITALLNEIDSRMKHLDGKRAVIVFFPNEKKLNEFIEAGRKQLEDRGHYVQKMSTLDTASERNARIRGAVTSGTITLAAADFGRGTDFVAFDKGLNARGGIHVIQTFFSRERTEEVQIQGRTARNTNNGSYSMVLNAEDLVRDFPALTSKRIEEIIASGKAYDELDAIRLARCDEELKKNSIAARDIDLHHESMELREGNVEKIKSYLKRNST